MSEIVKVRHLSYTYASGSAYERKALNDISFSVDRGEFLGIFGPNGSGKSTLAQHLNGLIRPVKGTVIVCGLDASDPRTSRDLWKKVGLVFQYPEHQIFQTSVYDEVAYGPRNLGLPEAEVQERTYEALREVGLTPENIVKVNPVTLSGGMRRRVAIAGILAIRPEILILDEPMAGLDAAGRKLILDIIRQRQERHETTIMISHDLKEVLSTADRIAVLDRGCLSFFGYVSALLDEPEILARYQFDLPEYLQVVFALAAKDVDIRRDIKNIEEAAREIVRLLNESGRLPLSRGKLMKARRKEGFLTGT
ncbi:energy-coupling factor transporter ATPase [Syntrophothermus lipocalidus]|uniref:ABC transporter related protein n=1 Tax=Syntrophothermus lipocalidus (strain DSM 12680 / TGB-C1) TaxID=643648 RepID=D7CJC0_SYNLT|nr:energy-coupling factor transporter ATPase [Syntrophothermus lipocalidus]ADI01009.1 ABC transporter related protein [Syntrophothermus lipocalidus DSM 12680]